MKKDKFNSQNVTGTLVGLTILLIVLPLMILALFIPEVTESIQKIGTDTLPALVVIILGLAGIKMNQFKFDVDTIIEAFKERKPIKLEPIESRTFAQKCQLFAFSLFTVMGFVMLLVYTYQTLNL